MLAGHISAGYVELLLLLLLLIFFVIINMAVNCLEIPLKIVMSHLEILKPNLELLSCGLWKCFLPTFDPGDWAAVTECSFKHI